MEALGLAVKMSEGPYCSTWLLGLLGFVPGTASLCAMHTRGDSGAGRSTWETWLEFLVSNLPQRGEHLRREPVYRSFLCLSNT